MISIVIEGLQGKIELIITRADLSKQSIRKVVAPYRVFKRYIASMNKEEFPNMRNQERQMIVKDKWHSLPEFEKTFFVAQARLEEERLYFT